MNQLWNNIQSNQGLELALAGILLVFGVLFLVSLSISFLPRILEFFGLTPGEPQTDETEIEHEIAAAAAAMHAHLNAKDH